MEITDSIWKKLLRQKARHNRKWYVAYQMTPTLMTSSDFEGYSPIACLSSGIYEYSHAAWQDFDWDSTSCGQLIQTELNWTEQGFTSHLHKTGHFGDVLPSNLLACYWNTDEPRGSSIQNLAKQYYGIKVNRRCNFLFKLVSQGSACKAGK